MSKSDIVSSDEKKVLKALLAPYCDRIERVRVLRLKRAGSGADRIDLLLDGPEAPEFFNEVRDIRVSGRSRVRIFLTAYRMIEWARLRDLLDGKAQRLFDAKDLRTYH